MPREVFNQLSPARVRSEKRPGRYADGNGLYLHVAGTGARWWIWRGVIAGRPDRVERGLGSARLITLAEARQTAWEWRRMAREGIDPASERDKARRRSSPTFAQAAERVWAEQIDGHVRDGKHAQQWIVSLRNDVFPVLGSLPVHLITQADVLRVLAPIWTVKPETARRISQRIKKVFDWAIVAGQYPAANPCVGVEAGLPKLRQATKHLAALPYDQLPDVMRRLERTDLVGFH